MAVKRYASKSQKQAISGFYHNQLSPVCAMHQIALYMGRNYPYMAFVHYNIIWTGVNSHTTMRTINCMAIVKQTLTIQPIIQIKRKETIKKSYFCNALLSLMFLACFLFYFHFSFIDMFISISFCDDDDHGDFILCRVFFQHNNINQRR